MADDADAARKDARLDAVEHAAHAAERLDKVLRNLRTAALMPFAVLRKAGLLPAGLGR